MKDLLITHTDLDGISPIILLNLIDKKFDYHCIDISEIPATFEELFKSNIKEYATIYIVDLTIPEMIYEELNKLNLNVLVFDHHESHIFARKYPYATVEITLDERPTCGTELFYNYLCKQTPALKKNNVDEYVEYVRQLDVYRFESDIPRKLEAIRKMLGKNEFIKTITRRLKKDKEHFTFTAFENRYYKLNTSVVERYIQLKEKEMMRFKIDGFLCGVVFAEANKSEVGNTLSIKNPDLDFIIVFDASKSVSYRTERDDVSVAEFAEVYKGGGHRKASGSPISKDMLINIIKLYYNNAECLDEES